VRWYWQAAYLPQCGFIAKTAHASKLAALSEREQYTQMELLRGTMANHSFVAYRTDRKSAARISFDDDRYLSYVPVRLPWTIRITERLPPGAAGVLINQTHIFNDLYVMIDEEEKRIFDAIDGRRSISEIVGGTDENKARDFFERLWRYDQVVFDASKV